MKATGVGILFLWACCRTAAAFSLTPGHFYGSDSRTIYEYDSAGGLVSSMSYTTDESRGIAIGQDGNLYVALKPDAPAILPRVEVISPSGKLVRSYPFTAFVPGKVSFSHDGSQFYIQAPNGLYRFNVGGTSGSLLNTIGGNDVTVLPSGELLVAENYAISRQSSDGQLLDRFDMISDPNHYLSIDTVRLSDMRGIAYSKFNNCIYISMLAEDFVVMQVDLATQSLVSYEHLDYPNDIEVLEDGTLLVGSEQSPAERFSATLELLGQMAGPRTAFVAQYPAPIFANGFE